MPCGAKVQRFLRLSYSPYKAHSYSPYKALRHTTTVSLCPMGQKYKYFYVSSTLILGIWGTLLVLQFLCAQWGKSIKFFTYPSYSPWCWDLLIDGLYRCLLAKGIGCAGKTRSARSSKHPETLGVWTPIMFMCRNFIITPVFEDVRWVQCTCTN